MYNYIYFLLDIPVVKLPDVKIDPELIYSESETLSRQNDIAKRDVCMFVNSAFVYIITLQLIGFRLILNNPIIIAVLFNYRWLLVFITLFK